MSQATKLYEGKAKIVYPTDTPDILLAYFKDDATAFNAQKRGQIQGKGEINCRISEILFKFLEKQGIATHYLDCPAANKMHIRAVEIIPVEVVVRNIAAGSLCRQTGLSEGRALERPLVEFYLKNDELGDPLLTRDRLLLLELVTPQQLEQLQHLALSINQHLQKFFSKGGITLVDFKLEFGFDRDRQLRLADEISPDTCRLWDSTEADATARVLDKDRFRRDLGHIEAAYQQVLQRVETTMTQI
ncbi:MAG: phosphoribosylaminoimidazolesuccinocarboxamide synthase [Cyanobacteriota bacterium]|nr:phosphoribosylaminoimidazolesuccinocarboxamide synthase [Cyanobacteriota bacterium]